MCRKLPVHAPGALLGTREVCVYGLAIDFESVAHARQQPVELLVAQINLAREELTDARLAYATEARQIGLGGAGFAHHRPQYLAPIAHI